MDNAQAHELDESTSASIPEPPARPWARVTAQHLRRSDVLTFVLFPGMNTNGSFSSYLWVSAVDDEWYPHGCFNDDNTWRIVSVDYEGDDPPRPAVPTKNHAVVDLGDGIIALRNGKYRNGAFRWFYNTDDDIMLSATTNEHIAWNIVRVIFEGED